MPPASMNSTSRRIRSVALPLVALIGGAVLGEYVSSDRSATVEISKRTLYPERDATRDVPVAALRAVGESSAKEVRAALSTRGEQKEEPSVAAEAVDEQTIALQVAVLYAESATPAMGYQVAVVAEFGDSGRKAVREKAITGADGVATIVLPAETETLVVDAIFEPSRQRVARRVVRELPVGEGRPRSAGGDGSDGSDGSDGGDLALELLIPSPFRVAVQLRPDESLQGLSPESVHVAWDGLQGRQLPPQGLGQGAPDRSFLASQVVHGYSSIEAFRVTVGVENNVVATGVFSRDEITSGTPPVLDLRFETLALAIGDADGHPLSDVQVYAVSLSEDGRQGYRAEGETGPDGAVRIPVPTATAYVCIGKPGYVGFVGHVVADGVPNPIRLAEIDPEQSVTVEVRDARGRPTSNALVTMMPMAEHPSVAMAGHVQAYTNSNGIARLPRVFEGACTVEASHREHGASSRGAFDAYDGDHAILYLEDVFDLQMNLHLDGAPWERNGAALYWQVEDLDYERGWGGSFMAGRTRLE